MPFSKRALTWNGEVLAGLAILFLVLLAVGVWWFYHGPNLFEEKVNVSELTGEARVEAVNEMAAELAADAALNGGPTVEERKEAASKPAEKTGFEMSVEQSMEWARSH